MEMATAALILGGVSTGISAIGKYQEISQQAKMAEYSEEVARTNAAQTTAWGEYQANMALEDAAYEKSVKAKDQRQAAAKKRLAFASSGMAADFGSPLEALSSAAADDAMTLAAIERQGKVNAQNIRYQSAVNATSYTNQANAFAAQASNLKRSRTSAVFNTLLQGGMSTLIGYGMMPGASSYIPVSSSTGGGALLSGNWH
ncbi:hypothetical protein [Desulfocurvus sp. DL9XJH121]